MSQSFPLNAVARYRISPRNPETLRHADVVRLLDQLQAEHSPALCLRELGQSVEGRGIRQITLGRGPKKVLLWSQMHGDEPTYTAVLLDLVRFLRADPTHAVARDILAQCTLCVIPMLNPDGAERFTRRNAQDLDINRDARRLQTPEGRILKAAQERLQPRFAFNLHDQNERTAVGRTGKVAAVSLLVPPLDYEACDNQQTLHAKRVAGCFYRAVARHCPGMISRYDAGYMPHAFGEAMQRAGVITVLVEAGGWHGHDISALAELHFVGLLSALHAIATDAYLDVDPGLYQELVHSGESPLFDLILADVSVENGRGHPAFKTDIGINRVGRKARPRDGAAAGLIDDLGDLRTTAGRQTIRGEELVCAPGRIVLEPAVTPRRLPAAEQIEQWLRLGLTTVIGLADMHDPEEIDRLAALPAGQPPRINIGFAGHWQVAAGPAAEPAGGFGRQAALLLAVCTDGGDIAAAAHATFGNLPVFPLAAFARDDCGQNGSAGALALHTRRQAERLGLAQRGFIGRGAVADLVLLPAAAANGDARRAGAVQYVVLNGAIVLRQGDLTGQAAGTFLTR